MPGQAFQIAAVNPDRLHRRIDGGGLAPTFERVVGVDEQCRRARESTGVGGESLRFGIERLYPRMSHRPRRGDFQQPGRLDVTGPVETGDVGSARREQPTVRPVAATAP